MGCPLSGPLVLCIGTTHPWNSAGIGRDAQVAAEFGLRTAAVVVGITAQDAGGMREKFAVPTPIVRAQLESLATAQLGAIRVGALFDQENVHEVLRFLQSRRATPTVVDPVFGATLGGEFADTATFEAFRAGILVQPIILTPNVPEAQRLTSRRITNQEEMIAAALHLQAMGAAAVLLKGGHLPGDPIDILVTGNATHVYREARLPGTMRGTGCTLAAALACELASGRELVAAVQSARAYVRAKIGAQTATPSGT